MALGAPSNGGGDSLPLELATFVTFHYFSPHVDLYNQSNKPLFNCEPADYCTLISWIRQTHRLATEVSKKSRRKTSVHVWTHCLGQADGDIFSTGAGGVARVHVHNDYEPRLRQALLRMERIVKEGASAQASGWPLQWRSGALLNLLRWSIVGVCTWAELVVSLDLDMDPLASPFARATASTRLAAVTDHWISLLRCVADKKNYSLFSLYDGSAPINTGYMILRPDPALYEEGLAVLDRAPLTFNYSHGWDGVGRPSKVVRADDHALAAFKTGRAPMEMFESNSWQFASGETDQGFFFYLYRILHSYGADLRMLPGCRRREIHMGQEPGKLSHYAGGIKPEKLLVKSLHVWNPCDTVAYGTPWPERRVSVWELARTIAWGRNTLEELDLLEASLEGRQGSLKSVAKARVARVHAPECRAFLDASLTRIDACLERWEMAIPKQPKRKAAHFKALIERRRRAAAGGPALQRQVMVSARGTVKATDYLELLYKRGIDDARPNGPIIS